MNPDDLLNRLRAVLTGAARPVPADATRVSMPAPPVMPSSRGMVAEAADAIARREGFRPEAYVDRAGRGRPVTIGYGLTGPDIKMGMTMTEPEARRRLEERVRADSARMASRDIPPSAGALSALYNLGWGNMRQGGVFGALEEGDTNRAADLLEQMDYGTVNGRRERLRGLTERRKQEADMIRRSKPREFQAFTDRPRTTEVPR